MVVAPVHPHPVLQPPAGQPGGAVPFGMEQDQFLARRRLHAQQEPFVFADGGRRPRDPHQEDAIRLGDTGLRPRGVHVRVRDVQHHAVFLLQIGQVLRQLQFAHLGERMPAQMVQDRRLVQRRDPVGHADLMQRGQQPMPEFHHRHARRHGQDAHRPQVDRGRGGLDAAGMAVFPAFVGDDRVLDQIPHALGDELGDLDRDARMLLRQAVEQGSRKLGQFGGPDGVQGGRPGRLGHHLELPHTLALSILANHRHLAIGPFQHGPQSPVENQVDGVALLALGIDDLARVDLHPLQGKIDVKQQRGQEAGHPFRQRQQRNRMPFGDSFQRRPGQEPDIDVRFRDHVGIRAVRRHGAHVALHATRLDQVEGLARLLPALVAGVRGAGHGKGPRVAGRRASQRRLSLVIRWAPRPGGGVVGRGSGRAHQIVVVAALLTDRHPHVEKAIHHIIQTRMAFALLDQHRPLREVDDLDLVAQFFFQVDHRRRAPRTGDGHGHQGLALAVTTGRVVGVDEPEGVAEDGLLAPGIIGQQFRGGVARMAGLPKRVSGAAAEPDALHDTVQNGVAEQDILIDGRLLPVHDRRPKRGAFPFGQGRFHALLEARPEPRQLDGRQQIPGAHAQIPIVAGALRAPGGVGPLGGGHLGVQRGFLSQTARGQPAPDDGRVVEGDALGDLLGAQPVSLLDELVFQPVQGDAAHLIGQVVGDELAHLLLDAEDFATEAQVRMGRGKGDSLQAREDDLDDLRRRSGIDSSQTTEGAGGNDCNRGVYRSACHDIRMHGLATRLLAGEFVGFQMRRMGGHRVALPQIQGRHRR